MKKPKKNKKSEELVGELVAPPDIPVPYPLKRGRKRKYPTPDTMMPLVVQYFDKCDERGDPYTLRGLCGELNISVRNFREYKSYPQFTEIIHKIRDKIEDNIITKCLRNKYNNSMGIFWMKNMAGWSDKQEVSQKSDPKVIDMLRDMIKQKTSSIKQVNQKKISQYN